MYYTNTCKTKVFGLVVYAVNFMNMCLSACPHTVSGAEINVKLADMQILSKEILTVKLWWL